MFSSYRIMQHNMFPADSARKPTVQVPHRLHTVGRVLAVVVDMLLIGWLTLCYDAAVAILCISITFLHNGLHNNQKVEATSIGLVMGILVGILAVIGLLLWKKYWRALAVLLGLLPLVFFTQLM
jgi:hypothetical protein